ncbi:MAG TPA: AmmeMemoRadiSam system protein B [Candidatus Sumerlaeota bacterium]|nr:AmmeMemoRadiSam system protein B [Candidatus Sumerlaeota bacterium]
MKRGIMIPFLAALAGLFGACEGGEQITRPCAGAGFWFPSDPKQLTADVDRYLKEATLAPGTAPTSISALISPHAGYQYSGPMMGKAFSTIRDASFRRAVILAFSHAGGPDGRISVLPVQAYDTPLGPVSVDGELVERFLKHKDVFTTVAALHSKEHSDENQLPFLKRLFPDLPVVCLLVGPMGPDQLEHAADILSPLVKENTLFIASTDLNHYGRRYGYEPFRTLKGKELADRIHAHDRQALDLMAALDVDGFRRYLNDTDATVCGRMPVELLMRILKNTGGFQGRVEGYYTSADKEGNHADMTCGYGAVVFAGEKGNGAKASSENAKVPAATPREPDGEPDPPVLNEAEQKTLLSLARDMLTGATKDRNYLPDISKYEITPSLKQKSRLFVTLTKGGDLRGCIGSVEAHMPIYEGILEHTVNAAFHDPRFPAVKASEVKDIRIEISINSPQRLVKDVGEIEIGKHGLVLEKGWNRGLLLPQVPVEWGWNREEFLSAICRKSGLPDGAWKDPEARLFLFSSQVFHERE